MKHVILGAGPAGVIAAETIRKHAPADEIVLVGDEPEAPYSRMAIPYLLMGNVGEAGTHLRHDPTHYAKLRITVQRGRLAAKVDIKARTVTLDDGSTLDWDRLLIATGSSPAAPPIPGMNLPGVHPCWTLKDARERFERDYVTAVLEHHRGRMGAAAKELGIERTNLYRKIKQLNIRWTIPD